MPQPQLTKLHRSRQHRILAGVMGGIAEYLGWSPTLTRILFVRHHLLLQRGRAGYSGLPHPVDSHAQCHARFLSLTRFRQPAPL